MADSNRVIEFLRDVRQGGLANLQAATEEITQMAAEYAALCAQANDRLRQCSAFLQQGLRTEAIHLAEQSPNLLDLISQLDLPDPQAWTEFCQNNGLPVPPPLQFDRAGQLNEAYAQEQPLEHLLARHRYLALSRAPIRERLEVMRKIAAIDSASTHWDKDLRDFEKARQKELPSAFYNAVKNHDDAAIEAMMDEVNRQPWQEPPPVELATAVADAYSRIQRTAVEVQLKKLVEPLRDAFAARSLQECQALVQRWKNAMTSAGVTHVSSDLMDEIKPVAAFVSEQTKRDEYVKRFNEACKAFTKLLDADATDAQLEAGYARLKDFKEEIPEDLIRRYMNKKTGRRRDADRSHKMRMVMTAGAAAAAIVVVLIVAYLWMTGNTADKWATKINEAVAKHSKEGIDEAQANVDRLQQTNAGLLKEPKVAAAVNALATLKTQYERDRQSIKLEVSKLDAARQAAALVLANNNATMEDLRTRGEGLDGAIKEADAVARDLSWADSENELSKQIAGATSAWKAMQERVLGVLRKELQAIGTDLDAVPATTSSPEAASQAAAQLATLASRAGALRNLPLLDDEARTSLAAMTARIAERRQGAAATGDVAAELERVRTSASSAAALKLALETFASRFPDDVRTADFKKALAGIPPALSLEAWQQMAASFKGELAAPGAVAAQKRAADIEAFVTAHPDCPRAGDLTAYAEYLHAAADALADKGTWQNAFTGLLANPLLADLQVMDLSDGRRYYTHGDVKRTEHRFNNIVSITFEAIDPKAFETNDPKEAENAINKRLTITIDPPVAVAEKPVPAPHAKMLAEISDDLKTINEANWESFGIDLADKIVNHSQMELVVKAILLQQILKTQQAVTGGQFGIADMYERSLSDLARQNPADIYWFDPPKVSDGTKKALTQIVAAVPPARTVKPRLAAGRAVLFKSVGTTDLVAGVVMKDDAGTWNLHTKAPAEVGTMVWAIFPAVDAADPTKGPTVLKLVGTAAGGKFLLDDNELKKMPQGAIVYVSHP